MKKTIAPAMTVLAIELKTNMQALANDVGTLPKEVFAEAINAGLHPVGPQYWIYEWESQDPTADFLLKISLPVATFGTQYSGTKFKLEQVEPFTHVSKIHKGAWENLKDTYGQIMEEMKTSNIQPGNISREVYINCNFDKLEDNITEVQFGVN